MKSLMKLVLVKAILFLMTISAAASHTTSPNAYASGSFVTANGTIARVTVARYQDTTTGSITTNLFYTTCIFDFGYPEGCQEGTGLIPNSAFAGVVYTNANQPDRLTLSVDTNAVAGFFNYLCFNNPGLNCGTQSPTTGGIISVSWTRTKAFANIDATIELHYEFGKLTSSNNILGSEYSAVDSGSFFGSVLVPPDPNSPHGPSGPTVIGTSTSADNIKVKFAMLIRAR